MHEWTAAEDDRERRAAEAGGVYYTPTAIGAMSETLVIAENAVASPGPAREVVLATTPGRELARVLAARLRARISARIRRRR